MRHFFSICANQVNTDFRLILVSSFGIIAPDSWVSMKTILFAFVYSIGIWFKMFTSDWQMDFSPVCRVGFSITQGWNYAGAWNLVHLSLTRWIYF